MTRASIIHAPRVLARSQRQGMSKYPAGPYRPGASIAPLRGTRHATVLVVLCASPVPWPVPGIVERAGPGTQPGACWGLFSRCYRWCGKNGPISWVAPSRALVIVGWSCWPERFLRGFLKFSQRCRLPECYFRLARFRGCRCNIVCKWNSLFEPARMGHLQFLGGLRYPDQLALVLLLCTMFVANRDGLPEKAVMGLTGIRAF